MGSGDGNGTGIEAETEMEDDHGMPGMLCAVPRMTCEVGKEKGFTDYPKVLCAALRNGWGEYGTLPEYQV